MDMEVTRIVNGRPKISLQQIKNFTYRFEILHILVVVSCKVLCKIGDVTSNPRKICVLPGLNSSIDMSVFTSQLARFVFDPYTTSRRSKPRKRRGTVLL